MSEEDAVEVTEDPSDELVDDLDPSKISEAVVFSSDWTTETIVEQLRKGNIGLSPRFQRRDAWNRARKSRLIESLILGLPVPQIVLAETQEKRGKYLVLDGKQRLLSLLQFWGIGEGANNKFPLSGLEVREDLKGKRYEQLENDPAHADDLAALQNQTVRTVVIRNWPSQSFLHLVFLRLNTGTVGLAPQVALEGDFDISVSLNVLSFGKPEKQKRTAFYLTIEFPDELETHASIIVIES
ncbi:MAG: DUF262 domain-containing protein, partial [Chloroflexi bacterium]|nr:DUF262 domain-containing protein [Chloroflexota bacterium]